MIRAVVISAILALPAHADGFVALAYDNSALVHGMAVAATPADAQARAMELCGETAGNCKLRLTRADRCVAIAVDYTRPGWASWHSKNAAEIETDVLNHCASFGNENCVVVETMCANQKMETN